MEIILLDILFLIISFFVMLCTGIGSNLLYKSDGPLSENPLVAVILVIGLCITILLLLPVFDGNRSDAILGAIVCGLAGIPIGFLVGQLIKDKYGG